ncbi:hypothetical protein ACHHYP_20384 [Achlya hypogyna]|uniref:Uncharacterized protein n=1 Tax=Achlya hypogyna TaxID=1202772 RepID=A0A1V9YP09_ACHHY|nr:hypothetical protein ACHHYP_20384 [Achlya hypogyna]
MAAKTRVVLVADAAKEIRDGKLGRFVRDAHAHPVLTFMRWRQRQSPRFVAKGHGKLYEIQRLQDDRSLFAPGNVVLQDGSVLLVTPMDPTFVLLEALASWKRKDQYCTVHDVMETSGVDMTGVDRWTFDAIARVCDTSDDGGDVSDLSIRANASKIQSFLRLKADRLVAAHKAAATTPAEQAAFSSGFQLPPTAGSTPAITTAAAQTDDNDDRHLQFALLTLSEYVDAFYLHPLIESYGLPLDSWDKEKKTDTRPKAAADLAAKYDCRQSSATKRPAPAPAAKTSKKKTVDTSGMKSIASFFGAK